MPFPAVGLEAAAPRNRVLTRTRSARTNDVEARQATDGLAVDDHPEGVVPGDDGDDLPGVGHADLDALAGDLDAAAGGDPPDSHQNGSGNAPLSGSGGRKSDQRRPASGPL